METTAHHQRLLKLSHMFLFNSDKYFPNRPVHADTTVCWHLAVLVSRSNWSEGKRTGFSLNITARDYDCWQDWDHSDARVLCCYCGNLSSTEPRSTRVGCLMGEIWNSRRGRCVTLRSKHLFLDRTAASQHQYPPTHRRTALERYWRRVPIMLVKDLLKLRTTTRVSQYWDSTVHSPREWNNFTDHFSGPVAAIRLVCVCVCVP